MKIILLSILINVFIVSHALASEEIQLAAAIGSGSGSAETPSTNGTTNTEGGTVGASPGEAAAAAATAATSNMILIGGVAAGLLAAIASGGGSSTSHH